MNHGVSLVLESSEYKIRIFIMSKYFSYVFLMTLILYTHLNQGVKLPPKSINSDDSRPIDQEFKDILNNLIDSRKQDLEFQNLIARNSNAGSKKGIPPAKSIREVSERTIENSPKLLAIKPLTLESLNDRIFQLELKLSFLQYSREISNK